MVKRAKYADKSDALRGVVTAPALGGCFDTASGKTKFDVSFVVGVVADKIENHLPLYRQAEMMAREGLPIHRSSLHQLYGAAAERLSVLYERMDELLLERGIIHADETPIRQLDPGREKCKKTFLWCRMTGVGPPLTVFRFSPSRSKETANALYGNYSGTIIRDAYVGCEDLDAGHAACWAHARRKFFDALEAGYRDAASELDLIRQLYKIEAEAKRRAEKLGTEQALFQERKTARRASACLAESFFDLCRRREGEETPGSPLRKAAAYALRLEKALSLFLEDPRLNLDNNPAENAIRPVAIGRNYAECAIMPSSFHRHDGSRYGLVA